MSDVPYKFKREADAFGLTIKIVGPGMSSYTSYLRPQQINNDWFVKCTADGDIDSLDSLEEFENRLMSVIANAFEAGRQDKAREIRRALEMKE